MKADIIIKLIKNKLNLKPQESWDNSGLQVGNLQSDINKVMLTLDADISCVNFAVSNGVDLIITHHPLIYPYTKSIDFAGAQGEIIQLLIKNNINLYSMHTDFDMAEFGVSNHLSNLLSIHDYEILHTVREDGSGYGGTGYIAPINILEYAHDIKRLLKAEYVRLYCPHEKKIIKKAAFCGGSGGEFIKDAIEKKCDVYITGDIKYHEAQMALRNDLCIIDAGHYNTERYSLQNIYDVLSDAEGIYVIIFEKNTVKEIII